MKNVEQFMSLTNNEMQAINGGGLLGSVNNTVNTANSLGASLGTTVTTLGAGAATALILVGNGVNSIGTGVNNLLTGLGKSVSVTV